MKKILLLALPLMVMCFASCEKDNSNGEETVTGGFAENGIIIFQDQNFLQALLNIEGIDADNDSQISVKEAQKVQKLDLSNQNISSISEIKYFTALEDLDCSSNNLTSIDISNNPALEDLSCSSNKLTTIDVSMNNALKELSCNSNLLSSLDVSANPDLKYLHCKRNQLSSLTIGNNATLVMLYCDDNLLTLLDLRYCTSLVTLHCKDNHLEKVFLPWNHKVRGACINEIVSRYGKIIEFAD